MSLIDQALKKTQSSLNQQKAESISQPEPVVRPTLTPTFRQTPRNPLLQRRLFTRRIKLPAFNKYVVFSMLGLILLVFGAFVIHANYDAQPLSLDGTMEMDNERVALINGNLYHKGGIIEGYRITQIHYNDVRLQNTVTHQSMALTPALAQ